VAPNPEQPHDVERKLAAILSADVHGYSRMMAEDEVATVRMLTSSRELIGERVGRHRGRVVDSPGDNLLAEFPSAIDAVQCAIEVQRALMARNADLTPQRWMEFRIGIHLGDVMVEGERIYGDGVNIAARLEGLAQPGGICISATVHEQVRGKLEADYDDIGEQRVKNIPRPVRALRIRMKPVAPEGRSAPRSRRRMALAGAAGVALLAALVTVVLYLRRTPAPRVASSAAAPAAAPTGKPSVAVLPFANLSADKSDEYFSDGMTYEIIGALSKIAGLQVAARTSSFMFKGQNQDASKIAGQLHVRNLLEGSVRRAANKVRISVELIDATSGFNLWSESYDKDMADIFRIQSEVAERVAEKLKVALVAGERERLQRKPTENLEAYNLALQGFYYGNQLSVGGSQKAIDSFTRAIALDPKFAQAYLGLANAYVVVSDWSLAPRDAMPKARDAARKALSIDGSVGDAHSALGSVLWYFDWKWTEAEREFRSAIDIDPNSAGAHWGLGLFLESMGRYDEALRRINAPVNSTRSGFRRRSPSLRTSMHRANTTARSNICSRQSRLIPASGWNTGGADGL
jgi:adenylate cyclase